MAVLLNRYYINCMADGDCVAEIETPYKSDLRANEFVKSKKPKAHTRLLMNSGSEGKRV
jgi:hypothetical protein